jgi:hypothetical protein
MLTDRKHRRVLNILLCVLFSGIFSVSVYFIQTVNVKVWKFFFVLKEAKYITFFCVIFAEKLITVSKKHKDKPGHAHCTGGDFASKRPIDRETSLLLILNFEKLEHNKIISTGLLILILHSTNNPISHLLDIFSSSKLRSVKRLGIRRHC